MLQLFFTFLLSLSMIVTNCYATNSNKLIFSTKQVLPTKRPINFNYIESSVESINDMILKEGGKVVGEIKKNKLKKGENFSLFLKRVGFKNKDITSIVKAIISNYPDNKILRKLPPKHDIYYAIPDENLGLGITFKIGRLKDIYVWENNSNKLFTKITKRPYKIVKYIKNIKVEDNLYNAAKKQNLPLSVFSELIKVLGFSIDFQRELRKGDVFETLFSQKIDLISNKVINYEHIQYISAKLQNTELKFYRYTTNDGDTGYFDFKGNSFKKTLMKTPLNGAKLSSGYGSRKHPILGFTRMHRGVDFAAPLGTPIFAAGNGIIEFSGWKGAYGKYIKIRHNNSYKTVYAHLSKIYKKKGTRVKQGEIIGALGSTGRSTGPHLHYEILINGKQVNPIKIKIPSGRNIPKNELKDFHKKKNFINRTIYTMKLNKNKKLALVN